MPLKAEVRAPNEKELRQTLVLALPLDEVSAKIRTGGPDDEDGHRRIRPHGQEPGDDALEVVGGEGNDRRHVRVRARQGTVAVHERPRSSICQAV